MSILNVPIQINGGDNAYANKLLDRELYIDKYGYLYYGSDNSLANALPVNVTYATNTSSLGDASDRVYITKNQAKFGNFTFGTGGRGEHWNLCGSYTNNQPDYNAHIYQVTINACQFSNIYLNNDTYGNSLPVNARNGQVFFKV